MSDLHHGSTVGLCPPAVTVEGGGEYQANKVQRWMWDCWEDCTGCRWKKKRRHADDEMPGEVSAPDARGWIRKIAGKRRWGLVVNGDAIEGMHHKQVEVIGNDVALHAAIARQVLGALAEGASTVFITRGTEVHVGTVENALGLYVGARYCKANKSFCWEQLQVQCNGVLTHFKHHMPVSMRPWTSSMQYAAAIANEQLNAIGLGHEVPRVLCRAHRHRYGKWSDEQGLVVVTPPWQQLTRHARKGTMASLAQHGIVALDYGNPDDDGWPTVHKKIYRPEPDEVIHV